MNSKIGRGLKLSIHEIDYLIRVFENIKDSWFTAEEMINSLKEAKQRCIRPRKRGKLVRVKDTLPKPSEGRRK